jgi:ornithine cyclodeaminase/alanine dehydrogenase-like protein (mu-crystallin family)
MKTLVLTQSEIPALLPMPGMIDAMEGAFRALAAGEATLPLRSVQPLSRDRGWFAVMPAQLAGDFGLKAIAVVPANEGGPHDSHPGAVLLFDPVFGRLIGIMDASAITALRTAAVSGLATCLLSRPSAGTLALLGAGTQARTHLVAMAAVRSLSALRVWSRKAATVEAFVTWARDHCSVPIAVCASAREAVDGADLICTVTSARTPVLEGAWLAPGAHVNAVGASLPSTRELDSEVVRRARVFVDRRESALAEAGDLLIPRDDGAWDGAMTELADVVAGTAPGRSSDEEITLFKSLGLAIEDLAAARALYERAKETNAGTWIDFGGFRE